VDEGGGVHFSDDLTKIPEKYRPSAVRVEDEDHDRARPVDETRAKGGEVESKDRLGRGETYWKERVAESKSRIKSLQDKNENLRQEYNELTTRFKESKNSFERTTIKNERDEIRQEMERNRTEIQEAMNVLEKKIPEEAELYKAKPEWIK
jgi:chromosome segregation ATPase